MFSFSNVMFLLKEYWQVFLFEGLRITLVLSAIAVFFGVIFGTFIAFGRMSKFKPLSFIATAYIEVVRGTPLLLQFYFFVFLLPKLITFMELSTFTSICIALICNSAAYVAELVRSGIQAVDKGQMEAARSLGMSHSQAMVKVIIPQAIKNILPAVANEFVAIIKETSMASTFFIGDLMTSYLKVKGATYLALEGLIIVGVIYFVVTFSLTKLINYYERKLNA